MYKLLLCWRYLRTRYIALASIVSVTLGVATMIVVNSVMSGFSREMQSRIHGILSDVVVESQSLDGFYDAERHMQIIREAAGEYIAGMTPTVHVPAMLRFEYAGQTIVRPITLIGIDPATYGQVGDYGNYLQHPENRRQISFALRDGGYLTRDPVGREDAPERSQLREAGWPLRRRQAEMERLWDEDRTRHEAELQAQPDVAAQPNGDGVATGNAASDEGEPTVKDPFAESSAQATEFDRAKEAHTGIVLGIGLSSYRLNAGEERFLVLPGEDVVVTVPMASLDPGLNPEVNDSFFTVVDLYESKMSEYDSNFCFVPLERLQQMRGMIEPQTGIGYVSAIQIKLKPGVMPEQVRDALRAVFPEFYSVQTWRDKQGPLLAAVQMETAILNVLLFLIIAVAGFGILAIFYMIVVEKTRDIGILKALGASGRGVMGIFLGYGLSLGVVGAGAGLLIGLVFVARINEIAKLLSRLTGHEVFDPSIYYFYEIPTQVSATTVSWIVLGALAIAVLASILPARRAARLHPVEALRYE